MDPMPFPSRLTIANAARAKGYIVASVDQEMTVETPDLTMHFKADGSIVDSAGTPYEMVAALRTLGIDLAASGR